MPAGHRNARGGQAGLRYGCTAQAVQLGPGTTSRIGFTGNAAYTLTHAADPETARLLATLTHFAAVACIGAQTTHGLGHIHAIPTNPEAANTPPRPTRHN